MRDRVALKLVPPLPVQEASLDLDPATVYRRYAAYVAAVAQRLLGHDADVDDTVQEVFVIAVRGLSGVRDAGAIKGWLARIAVRVARRRLRVRRLRACLGLEAIPASDPPVSELASQEQRSLLVHVYRALDTLPANQRIAWTLRHVEGEKLEAVAVLCDCSLATAKRRIAAAAQHLQEVMSDG